MSRGSLQTVRFTGSLSLLLVLSLTGCRQGNDDTGPIAYIAPTTVNLRRELSQKNSAVGLLKHGERVQMLEIRRRFIRVRTAQGLQGWVDASVLLTRAQMAQIQQDAAAARLLPSEGSATVYEALNVHLEPSRQSPAFLQIPEGGTVQVLAQKLAPKVSGPVRVSTAEFQKALAPPPVTRKEKKTRPVFKLPAKPAPPKPPDDWLALSGEEDSDDEPSSKSAGKPSENAKTADADPAKPVILENWTLIRTKDNQSGWVLSRNLAMSIPDEVAQYAEGRRITSYFDLGTVADEEKGPKHNWLWTTASENEPFDFDSWRVFLWNRRRHRFETAYRKRDVEGYFPVHVDPAPASSIGRTFQLILKNENSQLVRNSYAFDGVRVRLTGSEPYTGPQGSTSESPAPGAGTSPQRVMTKPNWFRDQLERIQKEFRRVGR